MKSLIVLTQNVQISAPTSDRNGLVGTGSTGPNQPLPEPSYRLILENVVDVARKRARLGIFEVGTNETNGAMG